MSNILVESQRREAGVGGVETARDASQEGAGSGHRVRAWAAADRGAGVVVADTAALDAVLVHRVLTGLHVSLRVRIRLTFVRADLSVDTVVVDLLLVN